LKRLHELAPLVLIVTLMVTLSACCSHDSGGGREANRDGPTSAQSDGDDSSEDSSNDSRDDVVIVPPTVTAPVIGLPGANPFYSNEDSVTLSGSCTTGNTIILSGDASDSFLCASSAFIFSVGKLVDGTYSFSFRASQTGGVDSGSVAQVWVRDTAQPLNPTIDAPNELGRYVGSETVLTLGGVCESGATVILSGSGNDSMVCASSQYSFELNQASDGEYLYSLVQTDLAGNSSASTSFTWMIGDLPTVPLITSPDVSPLYSSASSLTLSGSCTSGNEIHLGGDVSAGQVVGGLLSMTCTAAEFSFEIQKTTDDSYMFLLYASAAGEESNSVSQIWVRDTVPPAAPTVSSHGATYMSAEETVVISGACETNATVLVSGAEDLSVLCLASSYSVELNQAADGVYTYSLIQEDRAGNESSATSFEWTVNTSAPPAPTITTPASSPYYYNGTTSITISGGCVNGYDVTLSGASAQVVQCGPGGVGDFAADEFSFTVNIPKGLENFVIEGAHTYFIVQDSGLEASASASVTWVYQVTAPAAPSLDNPLSVASGATGVHASAGDITIEGFCASGATVYSTHVQESVTDSVGCLDGRFNFPQTAVCEAEPVLHRYELYQADGSGNSSAVTYLEWTKNCALLNDLVINSPTNPLTVSSSDTLTIQGTCNSGNYVRLYAVEESAAVYQLCSSNQFSFEIDRSAAGISSNLYSFTLRQQDSQDESPGQTSGERSRQWVRNGPHNTVALWHMDDTAPLDDSGLYDVGSDLAEHGNIDTGSVIGVDAQARSFSGTGANTARLRAVHTESQSTTRHRMTVEGWIKTASFSHLGNGNQVVLFEKTGAWKVRIYRQGGSANYRLAVDFSADGEVYVPTPFYSLYSGHTPSETTFNHLAVTFDRGQVVVYWNGAAVITSDMSASVPAMFNSGNEITIGSDAAGSDRGYNGAIDEVRISQTIRYNGNFTPPTAPFVAD
jgi:hypothetical protein